MATIRTRHGTKPKMGVYRCDCGDISIVVDNYERHFTSREATNLAAVIFKENGADPERHKLAFELLDLLAPSHDRRRADA